MAEQPLCRHCGEKLANRPRGLCRKCYFSPARDLYPATSKYANKGYERHEPTEEEVEATVAEQMKCLPAWWNRAR